MPTAANAYTDSENCLAHTSQDISIFIALLETSLEIPSRLICCTLCTYRCVVFYRLTASEFSLGKNASCETTFSEVRRSFAYWDPLGLKVLPHASGFLQEARRILFGSRLWPRLLLRRVMDSVLASFLVGWEKLLGSVGGTFAALFADPKKVRDLEGVGG